MVCLVDTIPVLTRVKRSVEGGPAIAIGICAIRLIDSYRGVDVLVYCGCAAKQAVCRLRITARLES
jgi:hypothetical protein